MAFQVIIVSRRRYGQIHITFFRQQQLLDAILIDHIRTVILLCGSTADGMHRSKLRTVGRIAICDGTAVTESYLAWQI